MILNPKRKSQYELQFKKWQFRKNCTAEGWKIVAHKLTKRKREQKETEVFLNGNLIHPKKLKKETQRYKALSVASESSPPGNFSYEVSKLVFSPQERLFSIDP